MKKSNLLKKAVSVLLVASALAGCGQLCNPDCYHSSSGASGTETMRSSYRSRQHRKHSRIRHHYYGNGFCMGPLSHLILQAPIQM